MKKLSGNITGFLFSTFHLLKSRIGFRKLLLVAGCWLLVGTSVFGQCTISATVTSTNITCNGANDGTISLTNPVNGTGSYEYRLNTGSWQAGPDYTFTGLSPATYDVQIRDANNTTCVVHLNSALIITQPAALQPGSINITVSQFCTGGTTPIGGTNSPYGPATGGSGDYTYTWQLSTGCTGTWTDISGTNTTSYTPDPPASTTCYRRKVTDNQCGTIAYSGTKTFQIYTDLVSQTVVPSPAILTQCAGTSVSATFSGGSGGFTGGYNDMYTYSTDGGGSWSSYTSGTPLSTTGLSGANIVQIRTRREPSGVNGCNYGVYNTVAWTINPVPTPNVISGPTSVCVGSTGNVYTTDAGMSGNSWTVSSGGTPTSSSGIL